MAARTVQLSNRLVAIVVRVARADVAELVDAHGSGPCGGNPVEVRVLSSAWVSRPPPPSRPRWSSRRRRRSRRLPIATRRPEPAQDQWFHGRGGRGRGATVTAADPTEAA